MRLAKRLTHFGKGSEVAMVDVTAKAVTARVARAHGFVRIGRAALTQVRRRKTPKRRSAGDRAHRGNRRGEAHGRVDTALSPAAGHAH